MQVALVEKIKIHLFRLHFLLTEPETNENIHDGLNQFKICYQDVLAYLSDFLKENYNIDASSAEEIFGYAFANKLVTEEMTRSLTEMANDFRKLLDGNNEQQIYTKIKDSYAHYLQVLYDMLSRMGQDAEEE